MPPRFKYRGRIPPDDLLHKVASQSAQLLVPRSVYVPGVGYVPQYAPTVTGTSVKFDPARNCEGYFTSHKFQAHNNCYNYAANIATNSIAQPGRRHGLLLTGNIQAGQVIAGAEKDGLILAGGSRATIADLVKQLPKLGEGHFTALLIAPADDSIHFDGDYHWVRSDGPDGSSWSQKDGPDQVTNFDFAGQLIANPGRANWTVNAGPRDMSQKGSPDYFVSYRLEAYMFVPAKGVAII